MTRSARRALLFVGIAALAVSHATPARAEPGDEAALELAKKAIYTDYLGTKFEDAEKKLKQAIALCGAGADCSAKVKAQLHRDLGVVYVGGMNRVDEGRLEFTAALAADAAVALDSELTSPEIQTVFETAKKGTAGSGGAGTGGSTGTGGQPAATPAPAAARGDLVHTPPPEQAILHPVPLYAELPEGTSAARVVLNYKVFGTTEWKTLAMTPAGRGYSGVVPCADVGSLTGSLKYFLQAFDAQSNPVSWSGTRDNPNTVAIKTEIQSEAPHLPGQAPPSKCEDIGDCPPEFPGCKALGADEEKPCEGENCPEPKPVDSAKKNWVSLAVQQNFLFLGGEQAACSGVGDYQCFRETGEFYNMAPYGESGGEIGGGIAASTTTVMAGYDRAIWRLTLGVRIGFAFGGGPQAPDGRPFLPVHAEGRVSYWFGADPFAGSGPRAYVTLAGGLAQADSKVSVIVYENEQDYIADKRLTLDAWRKAGTGFLSLGGGFMYAITPRIGPFAEVKVLQLLGAASTGLGAQAGAAFGF